MKMGFPTRLRESGSNRTPTQQGQNKLSLSFRQFAGKALASGISLNFSQTSRVSDGPVLRSQSVTNDGCPISARFWQMWDSTAVHRSLSTGNGSLCPWSIYTLYTQGPKFAESHICQNRGMGHPSFITDQAV